MQEHGRKCINHPRSYCRRNYRVYDNTQAVYLLMKREAYYLNMNDLPLFRVIGSTYDTYCSIAMCK